MERNTLFISHATPEDNEFSIWIASRLEMLGYKTWIDKNRLLGGEVFWATIQNEIKNNAIKVLLVYSKNICDSDGNLKAGIEKEILYAESIAKQLTIKDFIIPLYIDNEIPFNAFIGSNRLIHIPFDYNWAEGLKQLLKKLEKDKTPKNDETKVSTFSEWYVNEYASNCSIRNKKELFYSSWWSVDNIPNRFYMYQFSNATQAKAIRDANNEIPLCVIANVLSTFDNELNFNSQRDDEQIEIMPENTYSYLLSEVLNGFNSDSFPQHLDVENHFKRLLSSNVERLLKKNGLWKNIMSNKRAAYFLPNYKTVKPTKFIYPYSNKKKSKSIQGEFGDIFWHYAISFQPTLYPYLGFILKSHIVFTKDGFELIDDDKKQHSYRRKKGKRFFNEEWRDLQLAFIQNLKAENEIAIIVSKSGLKLKMKQWPEMFRSKVGYFDPNSDMDIDKIENYSEDELTDELEND